MRTAGGFPALFTNSVEMAEQSGTLDVELGRWAKSESALAAQAQDRAVDWMPKIFYFVIMLYIAWRIVGTFSGYFSGLSGMVEKM
jgi:type II secretory pathway component PulF